MKEKELYSIVEKVLSEFLILVEGYETDKIDKEEYVHLTRCLGEVCKPVLSMVGYRIKSDEIYEKWNEQNKTD